MSRRVDNHGPLPEIALAMLASVHQHRLLSTRQLHTLHTPGARDYLARRILLGLHQRGLLDRVQGPGTLSLWFLTHNGADTLKHAGELTEPARRVRLLTPAQAAGPLRAHTLAVNDVGVAFVKAAREHHDECTPGSWHHEIAHSTTPLHAQRSGELLVADALLSYLQATRRELILHQRFIELDRGTLRPAERLAHKISRYTALLHYTGIRTPAARARQRSNTTSQPLWRRHYRSFPHLLIVLADQTPTQIQRRIHATLQLSRSDPTNNHHTTSVRVLFTALADLTQHGPFAAIFTDPHQPEQPVNWLGQQPKEGKKPCPHAHQPRDGRPLAPAAGRSSTATA
jgi:Replication-relaxation